MADESSTKSSVDVKDPVLKMEVVKEVESTLEEEGYVKIDSTSSTSSVSTASSSVSLTGVTQSLSGVSLADSQRASTIASPPQQKIRPDMSPSGGAGSEGSSNTSSRSSSTWQRQSSSEEKEDDNSGGVWSWMSNAVSAGFQTTQNIGRNLVEKTKTSVGNVITTLDPEMEDYLYGRDQSISVVIATNDQDAVEAIKDGFRQVFEYVSAVSYSSSFGIAPLPVGYSAGVKGAQHRITNLIRANNVEEKQVVVGVEEMISELLPGRWFGLICLALNDPSSQLEMETFSQSVHIPNNYITKAEESTPSNYNLRWSGLSFTLGEVILGTGQEYGDWQSKISGATKRQIVTLAARTLAGEYQDRLRASADSLLENAVVM